MFNSLKNKSLIISLWFVIIAFSLWIVSSIQAQDSQILTIGELGIFSILPSTFFIGFSLLVISFFITLQKIEKYRVPLLIIQSCILMLFLNLTPALIEGTARFTSSYLNYRTVDFISQNGFIDPILNWVHNWPSFSIFMSIFTQITGFSGQFILVLYPTIFNLLLLFPIFFLFRMLLQNDKMVWLAVWFVSIANWVGQDYFSMQSLAFFVILLILLLVFQDFYQPKKSRSSIALVLLLFFYLVSSHLLSSIVILIIFVVFYISKHLSRSNLPGLFFIIIFGWTIFNASAYLSANISVYFSQFLNFSIIFQRNLSSRLITGSPDQIMVAEVRVIYSIIMLTFGFIGILLTWRTRKKNITDRRVFLLLIGFSILLFAFAYGGELFMRLYLLSLLPLGYFASKAIINNKKIFYAFFLFSIILFPSFVMIARYGNETVEYVPISETTGVNFLYAKTSSGQIIGGFRAADFRELYYHQNYTLYSYREIYLNNQTSFIWTHTGSQEKFVTISYGTIQFFERYAGDYQFIESLKNNFTLAKNYNLIYSNPSFSTYKYVE